MRRRGMMREEVRRRVGQNGALLHIAAWVAALTLGAPAPGWGESPPEEIDPTASCVNETCHPAVAERPHLHWAEVTEAGQCQRCHVPDANLHEFETNGSVRGCLGCHKEFSQKMRAASHRHKAARKNCLDCHDPHGSEVKGLLITVVDEDLSVLCFSCHDEDLVANEMQHGPAALGACNMCHDPHGSDHEKLLIAEGIDLCGDCHEDLAEMMAGASTVHEPVQEDCAKCHDPHSAQHAKLLRKEKIDLCYSCHEKVAENVQTASVKHEPVSSEDECLSCHNPHATANPGILREPQRDLCLGCHDERVEVPGDGSLIDMAGWLRDNPVWHKPVIEDDCSGCHNPHGGKSFRLLRKPFPAKFYAKFSLDAYGLCFSCHEPTIATAERTRTVTRFRNGDRNLHFLHVNKAKRGRSCRACHEVHASRRPLHIRERVPYGKWMMPINYEQTDDGGSCHPGCHDLEVYDRNGKPRAEKTRAEKPRAE